VPPHHTRHWVLLLLADRIDVLEGLMEDRWGSPRAGWAVALGVIAGAVGLGAAARTLVRG
jgi:hypothetical protein